MVHQRLLDQVITKLREAGASVEPVPAANAEQAQRKIAEVARSGSRDTVIVAGGDGTLRAVTAGALGSDLTIGLVPIGTGNVMAREIGLPASAHDITEVLLNGPSMPVRVGLANGHPFLLMAGVGFDGEVIRALNHHLKQRIGKLAYLPPLLRALTKRPVELAVTADGRSTTATWAIVAKAGYYGGGFQVMPGTSVLEPGLVMLLLRPRNRGALIAQLLAVASGTLTRRADVEIARCERVTIGTLEGTPARVQIDGDEFGTTPVTVEQSDKSVSIIMPRR